MRYLGLLIIIGPLILEFLIFSFITDIIGVVLAILLSMLTSICGVLILRVTATSIFKIKHMEFNLKKNLLKNFYPDFWNLFGGFLLILPGFFTDLIGVLLILPFTRRLLTKLTTFKLPKTRRNKRSSEQTSEGPIIEVPYEDLTSSKSTDNENF